MDPIAGVGENTGTGPAAQAASPAPVSAEPSPEVTALQAQLREQARLAGSYKAELEKRKLADAAARAASEAEKASAQAEAFAAELGPEGVEFWNNLAETSKTDPVKAARMLKDFAKPAAPPPPETQMQQPNPPSPATTISRATTQATPPPPPMSGDAAAPFNSTSTLNPYEVAAADSERQFNETVDRVQDPTTRNRTRRADRTAAFFHFANAAYLKALARRGQ